MRRKVPGETHVGVITVVKTSGGLVQNVEVRYGFAHGGARRVAALLDAVGAEVPHHHGGGGGRGPGGGDGQLGVQPRPLGDPGPVLDIVELGHALQLPPHVVYLPGQAGELGVKPGGVLLVILTMGTPHFH